MLIQDFKRIDSIDCRCADKRQLGQLRGDISAIRSPIIGECP